MEDFFLTFLASNVFILYLWQLNIICTSTSLQERFNILRFKHWKNSLKLGLKPLHNRGIYQGQLMYYVPHSSFCLDFRDCMVQLRKYITINICSLNVKILQHLLLKLECTCNKKWIKLRKVK